MHLQVRFKIQAKDYQLCTKNGLPLPQGSPFRVLTNHAYQSNTSYTPTIQLDLDEDAEKRKNKANEAIAQCGIV
jgi:hypothetical protein